MRTFKKARIAFDGLTVLIGENGTGKSTVLEALEILAQLTTRGADVTFARHFLGSLLRWRTTRSRSKRTPRSRRKTS